MSRDASPPVITDLPDDLAVLKRMIRELLDLLHRSQHRSELLEHRLDQLLRRVYGPRSERIDPGQLSLFEPEASSAAEACAASPAAVEEPRAEPRSRRSSPGRRKLPADLPRRQMLYELPEAERLCPCCGELRQQIGTETSEQLEYHPASLYVIEHRRAKYACRSCEEHVLVAPKPPQPIDKGLPGPGLLAWTAICKYGYHQPLYRLEKYFAHHGLKIPRSTTCEWMAACARLARPVYEAQILRILQSKVLASDDTPVRVLDRGGKRTVFTGRFWDYIGDAAHPFVIFQFTPDRSRAGPLQFLDTFRGSLQADAYSGYNELFRTRPIVQVGCWMHARRKFFEARHADPRRSLEAIARIKGLYAVENEAADLPALERMVLRQQKSVPQLEALWTWLDDQQRVVLPKSPIGMAVSYSLSNWTALCRYTQDSDLAIDNGAAERPFRQIALGRNNWRFCGSPRGGETRR